MKTKIAAYTRVIALLLISCRFVNAQQTSLGIINIYNNPDTAYEGVPYNNIVVIVQNTGNNLFTGTINIISENSDTTYLADTLLTNQTLTLFPGDTGSVIIQSHQFTPNKYKAGINIVVVWPRMSNGTALTSSSYTDSVYFVPLSGVHGENQNSSGLFLYPNPAKDFIYLEGLNDNSFEHVRIFDSKGTVVQSLVKPAGKINIHSLPDGLYLLEVKRKNLPAAYQKFIKQRE